MPERGSLYNTVWWRKTRVRLLNKESLCRMCLHRGVLTKANTIDHIEPHTGGNDFYCSDKNLQSLCKACHWEKSIADRTLAHAKAVRKRTLKEKSKVEFI